MGIIEEKIIKFIENARSLPEAFLRFLTVFGLAALYDDRKDIGKFSTRDHPSPFHHWQIGLLCFLGGIYGLKKYWENNST